MKKNYHAPFLYCLRHGARGTTTVVRVDLEISEKPNEEIILIKGEGIDVTKRSRMLDV